MPSFRDKPTLHAIENTIRSAYRSVLPQSLRQVIWRARNKNRQVTAHTPHKGPPYLSMILATYNVASYIEDFLESILAQEGGYADLELIFVDDGSTDYTPSILQDWAERYPRLIRVIRQENQGVAGARNTGLDQAKGKWVSFPDPDDFLNKSYLRHSRRALAIRHQHPLLAVCTKLVFYHEKDDTYKDNHPLNYRFKKPLTHVRTDKMSGFIQMASIITWLRRSAIEHHELRFKGHNWASFEDTHFVNRLFIAEQRNTVSFTAGSIYYYRKRADASSLIDTSKYKKSYYLDQLESGSLDLIRSGLQRLGYVPDFIQRTVLYDIVWRLRYIVDNPDVVTHLLTQEEQTRLISLLHEIFSEIDSETISSFHLAGCTEEHKVALLGIFKGEQRDEHSIYLKLLDHSTDQAHFHWYAPLGTDVKLEVTINGVPTECDDRLIQTKRLLGIPYIQAHAFHAEMKSGDRIEVRINGTPAIIKRLGKKLGYNLSWQDLNAACYILPPVPAVLRANPEAQRLRDLITSPDIQQKYHNCWLFMDASDRADDNAEHLYRHLMKQDGISQKIWFVLEETSADWGRLEAEGFQLLPYGSDDHIAAQMNANLFASSHIDNHILWPVNKGLFQDLIHYKFIFLQHGVIFHDLSHWLNNKPITTLLTTSKAEYSSITAPQSSYLFTEKEIFLSGLPRHDTLLSKARLSSPDTILIMPTWRKYLQVDHPTNPGQRLKIRDFQETDYFKYWGAVLHDPHLTRIAAEHKLKIVFAPHQNMSKYIEDFDVPHNIKIFNPHQGNGYQDLLTSGQILITDHSSVAFDIAYLERPVAYFQFDTEKVFSGDHVCRKGYFDYTDDGFGPVTTTPDDLLDAIENTLNGKEDPKYAQRRRDFFAHRDGQCCARVQDVLTQIAST